MFNLKLFETESEYSEYMGEEPIFPNVSYVTEDKVVHYNKTKPLATSFMLDQFYVDELNYILNKFAQYTDDFENGDAIAADPGNGVWVRNGSDMTLVPDLEFADYLSNLKVQKYDDDCYNFDYIQWNSVGSQIVFISEEVWFGSGFICGSWAVENGVFGLYQGLPG